MGMVLVSGKFTNLLSVYHSINAHLSHGYGDKNPVKLNERGKVLEQFFDEHRLMSVLS